MSQADSGTLRNRRPTTTAMALWGHLLRPSESINTTSSQTNALIPPLTPVDKNGTSMRILLHDTQMNLERFSERVDRLVQDVGSAKTEIGTVQKLFEHDHEKIVEETVSLSMSHVFGRYLSLLCENLSC